MHPDPTKRLSLEAIKRHRWYQRSNSLLEAKSTQCNDPATLAERLLQGLIMNGEMDYAAPLTADERANQLHSDGARAHVPETVSFTQPEAMQSKTLHLGGSSSDAYGHSLPSSTAAPRNVRRSDFLDSLSQQLTTRRENFAQSQSTASRPSTAAMDLQGSQFTQALNFLTQPSTALSRSTLSLTPNLTRFLSHSSPPIVALRLTTVFHAMRIQNSIEPLGDANVDDEDRDAVPAPREGDQEMELDGDEAAGPSTGAAAMSRSSSGSDVTAGPNGPPTAVGTGTEGRDSTAQVAGVSEGAKGIRIRLGLMDSRKCPLKGEVRIERLRASGDDETGPICLVMMRRSRGNPLEWRRVFGKVVKDAGVRECIYAEAPSGTA